MPVLGDEARVISAEYRFRSEWELEARATEVIDVLEDLGTYPQWWPQVRSAEECGDKQALLRCRSFLPYVISLVVCESRRDRAAGILEAHVSGDIEGVCRWVLTDHGARCHVVFEEEVRVRRLLLRTLGAAFRPLLYVNHLAMMACGRRGITRYLRERRAPAP